MPIPQCLCPVHIKSLLLPQKKTLALPCNVYFGSPPERQPRVPGAWLPMLWGWRAVSLWPSGAAVTHLRVQFFSRATHRKGEVAVGEGGGSWALGSSTKGILVLLIILFLYLVFQM